MTRVLANGLEHNVLEWEPSRSAKPRGTVFLVHGFMDAAATWDRVAPTLASAGLRVLAPDMRGFGAVARVPSGGYYHFVDYVFDLADLGLALSPEPFVVGHSMGGTVATMLAGTFPERITRLVSMEGLGPPDHGFDAAPVRMRAWIEQVRALRARGSGQKAMTREEALERLAANHPGVPKEVLATRLEHLVEPRGDRVALRADPLHRTTAPFPFYAKAFHEFQKRITCPVLFVSGGPSGWHPPDEADRIAAFADARTSEIADAGHMMHWTKPSEVAELLLGFL